MRILMLGWEFPPFIAGGLGTACYGLTRALDRRGHEVLFVLPRAVDTSMASHVQLLTPASLGARRREVVRRAGGRKLRPFLSFGQDEPTVGEERPGFQKARFFEIEAGFDSPYRPFAAQPAGPMEQLRASVSEQTIEELLVRSARGDRAARGVLGDLGIDPDTGEPEEIGGGGPGNYGGDLFGDAHRYARLVARLAEREEFDIIHAHDWLTYPAGVEARRVSGKPLAVHVHATEFDRSGDHVHQGVYDIERWGMHAADKVIAVSQLTKEICSGRYGVPAGKIEVVYNGVDQNGGDVRGGTQIESKDKIVLFLGRITMQKGPEYFIMAAKRVLEVMDNVKFVVAGSGDLALRMIEQAAQLGIGHKVLFTGFLRGKDVERVFSLADCYVMPSVSEPFGIAALEAMRSDVPTIISKQSGVSEVLTHALKVDFWDIDEMANKIVAVLRYAPLGATLREHGAMELRGLSWDGAAARCERVYSAMAGG
ncbi:MAG: glycosyltransferase family 4 protein [Phycisphaerales bacterium]|jgi:glycosyltransferase involved in cell wall biosynthesis|nr:glycosyltransferase family 4 protein [Phycisphaerales bacterium]